MRLATTASPEDLRSTLRPRTDGDRYRVGIDDDALTAVLGPKLPPTVRPTDAYMAAGDRSIGVVPGRPGLGCCARGSGEAILAALGEQGTTQVRLDKGKIPPAVTRGQIGGVAATDLLGEFTTPYRPRQARVKNIQKLADLLNGTIVQPDETFSINDTVGPRTVAGGWVPAGTIVDGELEPTPGGGISQYATTLYNALFFAGLRVDQHKPHSIYFSRYPLGREATMGYPGPDLVFTNDTHKPVVLWSSYDDRSITVQVWGTDDGRSAEALEPVVSGYGACRTVRITRQITWPDGSVTRETDRHSYRPEADEDC